MIRNEKIYNSILGLKMFVGLRRSDRLKEKLYPRYCVEYKIYMRQLSILIKSLSNSNWIDITLSSLNFYKIRIKRMLDLMKLYKKSLPLILYCSPYQSGLRFIKMIYKKTFDMINDIQKLTDMGDIETDDKNIRSLIKYFDWFRKYYKTYRYNNWESIINAKQLMDEHIINKIDEYL